MRIQRRLKKKLIVALITFTVLVLGSFAVLFAKRDALLKKTISKVLLKAKNTYHVQLNIHEANFTGLSTVNFKHINIVPLGRDTFANLNNVAINVKLLPLLWGDIKIGELNIYDAKITLIKKDSLSNYDFLLKKKPADTLHKAKLNLAELGYNLLHKALDKIPDDMDIKNFSVCFTNDTTHINFLLPTATIKNGELKSTLFLNKNEAIWHLDGDLDPSNQQFNIFWYAGRHKVEFPYLEKKYGLKFNFDTLQFALKSAQKHNGNFEVEGSWGVKNLLINHSRIASENVIVKNGSIAVKMIAGENFVAIDSASTIFLGKAWAHPYFKYTLQPNKIFEFRLNADEQNAQEIFNAFPIGLFESLEGIKVAGKLKYNVNLYFDTKHPNRVVFNSDLEPSPDFKILAYGKNNLQKINNPFIYTPYEKGKPVRDILIAPENPNYTPISQISSNIKNALLTSEDPSFYSHKGFVEESIRQSIATNYKAKSFKRGGSTISMQLVKNIYLSRQKTIARKIEEILIVWLIENQHICTKNRMYEVYLNIIEWGKNVYGIGEASQYYFGKSAAELSLGEGIYLASIVPKPKASLYAWQPDGSLKPHVKGYFNLIGRLMAQQGYTPRDTNAYGFYSVRIKESLRQTIAPQNYIMPDSSTIDDDENFQGFDIFKTHTKDTVIKKISFFNRLLGITPKTDSTGKTPKQLRQQRREERRKTIEN
ncbi:MAG: penicillin-binding protein [Sphingobacteriales bacterium]|nr:MAG: penicillin-binding protein [Sphingobacteriales bacterium]TAF81535.1 MAG: penicillin-binding protein [Sphingobacteriales bacterium]